jgi:hypothetical protein
MSGSKASDAGAANGISNCWIDEIVLPFAASNANVDEAGPAPECPEVNRTVSVWRAEYL